MAPRFCRSIGIAIEIPKGIPESSKSLVKKFKLQLHLYPVVNRETRESKHSNNLQTNLKFLELLELFHHFPDRFDQFSIFFLLPYFFNAFTLSLFNYSFRTKCSIFNRNDTSFSHKKLTETDTVEVSDEYYCMHYQLILETEVEIRYE